MTDNNWLFHSRTKLKDQQHQHNQEQPIYRTTSHISECHKVASKHCNVFKLLVSVTSPVLSASVHIRRNWQKSLTWGKNRSNVSRRRISTPNNLLCWTRIPSVSASLFDKVFHRIKSTHIHIYIWANLPVPGLPSNPLKVPECAA